MVFTVYPLIFAGDGYLHSGGDKEAKSRFDCMKFSFRPKI